MIVMEMIMCLSLHIKRKAALLLSVWDANRKMFYGLRHTEESQGNVMAGYTTASPWSRHLAHSVCIHSSCFVSDALLGWIFMEPNANLNTDNIHTKEEKSKFLTCIFKFLVFHGVNLGFCYCDS